MVLPQKSGIPLGTVSTTCSSGWVRSCAATDLLNTGIKLRTHPLPQVVLTVSNSRSGL